jgi:hypothetical protein
MWPRDRYNGPGGGLYTGPSNNPYKSNQPPKENLLQYLKSQNLHQIIEILRIAGY